MPFEEVMLLENPSWYNQTRRHRKAAKLGWRRRHGGGSWAGLNPIRRRRRMRNPVGAFGRVEQWTQGVDMMDILAGAAGLVITPSIANMFVRPAAGTAALTTGQKWMKLLVSGLAAVGVGFVVGTVGQKRSAKAAVLGGLAGTAVLALQQFTNFKIGAGSPIAALGTPMRFVPGVSHSGVGAQKPGFENIKIY